MNKSENVKSTVRQTLSPDWDRVGITKSKSIFLPPSASQADIYKPFAGFEPHNLRFEKPKQRFITGSSYEGTWDALTFSGTGTYVFAHGAIYDGDFKDGQFHGNGTITYPLGHKVVGSWINGRLIHSKCIFQDGLVFKRPWKYCVLPDRRFQIEFNTKLKGPGKEFLTNRQPTIEIPKGCFDTIDGFYEPNDQCVYAYDEDALAGDSTEHKRRSDSLKRIGRTEENDFIKANYRAASLDYVGYRPELYEVWNTGKGKDVIQAIAHLGLDEFTCSTSISSESSPFPITDNAKLGADTTIGII